MDEDTTVGTREAGELLGVTEQRVRQLVSAGDLPARRVYGQWRIERRDVEARRDARKGAAA